MRIRESDQKVCKVQPEVALTSACIHSFERENMLVKPQHAKSATVNLHLHAELNNDNPEQSFDHKSDLAK